MQSPYYRLLLSIQCRNLNFPITCRPAVHFTPPQNRRQLGWGARPTRPTNCLTRESEQFDRDVDGEHRGLCPLGRYLEDQLGTTTIGSALLSCVSSCDRLNLWQKTWGRFRTEICLARSMGYGICSTANIWARHWNLNAGHPENPKTVSEMCNHEWRY